MPESPDETAAGAPRSYAAAVTAQIGAPLGGALTAAYLHGSSVLGGWNAERSDVDILFVVTDDIGERAVERAGEVLLQAAVGCPGRCLEASIVTASAAARPAPPWPFVLHVGCSDGEQVLHGGADSPGDPDLLMHYAVCRAAGLALAGPSPQTTIGPVDRRIVLRYLAGELGWGLANAPENYAVLNACRALVYLRQGRIVGKVAGGRAALDDGSGPAGVIRRALNQQQAMAQERTAAQDAVAFVRAVAAELRAAAAAPSASPRA